MQVQRPFGFWTALALAVVLAVVGAAGRAHAQGNSASTVVRTLVYHEITAASAPVDTNGGAPPILSASGNGSKVISTYDGRTQVRIASADGRGGRPLVTLNPDTGRFEEIRLSSDGSLVFFLLAGDQPELADRTPLPAGLYVVNADGSG